LILEMRGTRVVLDPWFDSGWVIRQQEPLGLTPEGLPSFAAVLVTHRHRDHFDPGALRRLAATVPEVVARPELHARLARLGFRRARSPQAHPDGLRRGGRFSAALARAQARRAVRQGVCRARHRPAADRGPRTRGELALLQVAGGAAGGS